MGGGALSLRSGWGGTGTRHPVRWSTVNQGAQTLREFTARPGSRTKRIGSSPEPLLNGGSRVAFGDLHIPRATEEQALLCHVHLKPPVAQTIHPRASMYTTPQGWFMDTPKDLDLRGGDMTRWVVFNLEAWNTTYQGLHQTIKHLVFPEKTKMGLCT